MESNRTARLPAGGAAALALALSAGVLAACKEENRYVAPPPPRVGVATPVRQAVTPYLEVTGSTAAINTVDLVARVEGFITNIGYVDGALAHKGDLLFQIEQDPYRAKFQQAEASVLAAKAELVAAQAEFNRQSTLLRQDVTAQATMDQARAKRDSDQANVENQQAGLETAGINLNYTRVIAPFDGVVTRHLVSEGELVGATAATKLATVVQLDPIYVTFNVSEQDLLKVRQNLGQRRISLEELQKIPLELGLMDETGFPHKGTLNYASPEIDPQTGTILVRGILPNPDRALLPGFFVRVRVPMALTAQEALLVPDRVVGQNQDGRYVLVLNANDEVEQRKVELGQLQGSLRVIASGLRPDDRVVVTATDRATPGRKVAPAPATISTASLP
jgi:RND family efflux transporter MFP subunit